MPLSIFGFSALWSPVFFGILVVITVLYFMVTIKWRKNFSESEPLTKKEGASFLTAIVLLYIIKGSPADLMGHILFSVHMVQMAFLLLLVAPFLITGIPPWIWQKIIKLPVVRQTFAVMTRPMLALGLFTVLFSFYHLPAVLDFIKQNEFYHASVTTILFLSAIFMWWPIVNRLPDAHKVHGLTKIGYIIGSGALLTPACALIIFGNTPFYATYSDGEAWLKAMELCVPASTLEGLNISGPELFTNMQPLDDQQLGGIAMKVLQEFIMTFYLGTIFYQWVRREEENGEEITAKALRDRKNILSHQQNL